ncbi:hypothetical protein K7G98_00920 [Saccharothrix sp. MB29]|nr:hypothetical protein [Saccharothrix sp. MB29]
MTGDITRFVAREGGVYSLAAGALLGWADVPAGFRCATTSSPRVARRPTTAGPPSPARTAGGWSNRSPARSGW